MVARTEPSFDIYPLAGPVLPSDVRHHLLAAADALNCPLSESETEGLVRELARDAAHAEQIRAVCRARGSDFGIDGLDELLGRFTATDVLSKLLMGIRAVCSRVGMLAFHRRSGPFAELPDEARQQVVLDWSRSRLSQLRALNDLVKKISAVSLTHESHEGPRNPLLEAIGYDGPAGLAKRIRTHLPPSPLCSGPLADARLLPPIGSGPLELVCDCAIVGSGVGGSVLAYYLAKAGYQVLMLEKGNAHRSDSLEVSEPESYSTLYERGGVGLYTDDLVIGPVLAGSSFGGGSTVNWSCSLDPIHKLRSEWARDYGLSWAGGDGMAGALDAVKEVLAVHSDGVQLSPANAALMRGCERLGYHAAVAPQQGYPACPGDGGLCGLGYKGGKRQGMHGSVLQDAAATGKFRYLPEAFVRCISIEGGQATGATGTVGGRPFRVRARVVACAAGALHTPLLLRRSGLTNRHIGQNLRIHPVSVMRGIFKDPMRLWEGMPMTAVSRVAEDLDGRGYGVKLEIIHAHPLFVGMTIPWRGDPVDYKRRMCQMDRTAAIIVLARDTGSGRVVGDERCWPRLHYKLSRQDASHITEGLVHAARILVAAGAEEISWLDPMLPPYTATPAGAADPGLEDWIAKFRARGHQQPNIVSAHQMGTSRMAADPRIGAVKPSGETWEVGNLFVCDTSTFPTASGSNPMMTCAAISHLVAQEVLQRLGKGCGSQSRL